MRARKEKMSLTDVRKFNSQYLPLGVAAITDALNDLHRTVKELNEKVEALQEKIKEMKKREKKKK